MAGSVLSHPILIKKFPGLAIIKEKGLRVKYIIGTLMVVIGVGVLGYFIIKIFMPWVTVTSWWRTPEHNAEVGGVSNSLHMIGWAYDIVPADSDTETNARSIFFWATILNEGNHIHIQLV